MRAFDEIDELAVNNLRVLSAEMIERASSGHPGLPLGAAPMMWALWSRQLRIDPQQPQWANRDRFILSAGHGSALLYSLLHVSGFNVTMADLQHFRQFGSHTPGHPELGIVDGVEATTGPLGQGLGMAVGMALAERQLAAQFSKTSQLVDHYTYALVGDGDLMEGVSHEAASFAGNQQLQKLIVLYDDNQVSLDGPTSRSFRTNVCQRFDSYGWDTQTVTDGNDMTAINMAIERAQHSKRPSLIAVKTTIGFGAPQAGTNAVHGNPLGPAGLTSLRQHLGWRAAPFTVMPAVAQRAQQLILQRGQRAHQQWQTQQATLPQAVRQQFEQQLTMGLPVDLAASLPTFDEGAQASRITSHTVIQRLATQLPGLVGGAADLASSNKTTIEHDHLSTPMTPDQRNIAFGVREFGMGTILNGLALHGGLRVFGGTFLVFSDYTRAAIRLAAMMKLPVTYVFTHDSIAVGEDGPTHQPIEQLMSLRLIPNVTVMRPADPNETVAAWWQAINATDHPTVLVLTRQNLAVLPGSKSLAMTGVARGGYVLSPQQGRQPTGILIASGSEVTLAIQAQAKLAALGEDVSVVSMPSMENFARQPLTYQTQVLPPHIRRRVAVEMGATLGWERYVGLDGTVLGLDHFGASGAADQVLAANQFTVADLVRTYQQTHVGIGQQLRVI
ncbi:transketolase [Lactiplantibacillus paraplantarum]|uniref:transketolase n=1 Tax=Lactiplantibacillus paraplantarum TaxID=60520 RepID=UPI0003ADAAB8|nr:transketolase [Lactiplantibacillus paraplantarum]AVW09879.1 transketolase [Lactiplantibacillus paraplantarum]ERL43133.1 transketolase [Lactiplantibacillus paraplantarum]QJU49981.1 transketolase [Lactiplantibacillus paraplantarum]RKD27364.1 transketolase [Lactiplantibacillus paraplantarum]UKB42287.1 transketolase [Lactiplantibacillus paraplantarum]